MHGTAFGESFNRKAPRYFFIHIDLNSSLVFIDFLGSEAKWNLKDAKSLHLQFSFLEEQIEGLFIEYSVGFQGNIDSDLVLKRVLELDSSGVIVVEQASDNLLLEVGGRHSHSVDNVAPTANLCSFKDDFSRFAGIKLCGSVQNLDLRGVVGLDYDQLREHVEVLTVCDVGVNVDFLVAGILERYLMSL